eukprot:GSChrysophyteH1.ASY1.ANO1.2174.1 assembled CDS
MKRESTSILGPNAAAEKKRKLASLSMLRKEAHYNPKTQAIARSSGRTVVSSPERPAPLKNSASIDPLEMDWGLSKVGLEIDKGFRKEGRSGDKRSSSSRNSNSSGSALDKMRRALSEDAAYMDKAEKSGLLIEAQTGKVASPRDTKKALTQTSHSQGVGHPVAYQRAKPRAAANLFGPTSGLAAASTSSDAPSEAPNSQTKSTTTQQLHTKGITCGPTSDGTSSREKAYVSSSSSKPFENYVKRNLKLGRTTYKKVQKDSRFNRKTPMRCSREPTQGEEYIDTGDNNENNKNGGSNGGNYGGTGLDLLHVTLDAMSKKSQSKQAPVKPKVSACVQQKPNVDDVSLRGKKSKSNPYGLTDDFWEQRAPVCSGHSLPAKLLVVKKEGPNRGRRFYGCCYSSDQRCKFFMWAEENPEFSETALSQEAIDAEKHFVKLTSTGKREEIVARLGKEALRVLDRNLPEQNAAIKSNNDGSPTNGDSEGGLVLSDSDDELIIGTPSSQAHDSDDNMEGDVCESSSEKVRNGGIHDDDDDCSCGSAYRSEDGAFGRLKSSLINIFGFKTFRTGQEWAIQRVIDGKNSLLVMPTGAGKSLCYMLPAALLPGLTLVVSPLISLMQDQLRKLPVQLPGACFGGGMSVQEVAHLSSMVMNGFIKVLYVSPEKLCTSSFKKLMRDLRYKHNLNNPVSLLCVDEAHCLSQWSYNFRPAFLRIQREVSNLRPRAILALTATAPPHIQADIMHHLQVPKESGLLALPSRRNNLFLVLKMFPTWKQIKTCQMGQEVPMTIVYMWRRSEAQSCSEYLQSHGLPAVAYHAGMDAEQRQKSQAMFDRGTARIVVATTAFGMGVDKANVRRIIHGSLPKSVENYLQEVGRAGRDGKTSECHMLLCDEDVSVLTLMLQEQISRKQDKLVLAQRMKEREKQVAELDTKRSFLDGTLKQKISEVHQTVDAVAGGFRDDDEEEKIMSKDAMEES